MRLSLRGFLRSLVLIKVAWLIAVALRRGDQRPWKRWWFVSNRTVFVWGLSSQCSEGHSHYYLSLPESGVYPASLGFALLKACEEDF